MKKPRNRMREIPRSVRIAVDLVVLLVLLTALYLAAERPMPLDRVAFRRAEKANLVGPSRILTVLDLEDVPFEPFDRLIVGETDRGILFYNSPSDRMEAKLNYRTKTGPVTVLAPQKDLIPFSFGNFEVQVPVFVFHDFPDAVRGELEMQITGDESDLDILTDTPMACDRQFRLQSAQCGDGYLLFWLVVDQVPFEGPANPDANAAELLCTVCDSTQFWRAKDLVIPATVRLYDADDRLITEQTCEIRSEYASEPSQTAENEVE